MIKQMLNIFILNIRATPELAPYGIPILAICIIVLIFTWINVSRKVDAENEKKNYLINVSKDSKNEALQENEMLFKMLEESGPSKVSNYFLEEFGIDVKPTYYNIKVYLKNTKRIIESKFK